MIDKEWLDKVYQAFLEYERLGGTQPQVFNFIHWIYVQYGIVPPTDRKP